MVNSVRARWCSDHSGQQHQWKTTTKTLDGQKVGKSTKVLDSANMELLKWFLNNGTQFLCCAKTIDHERQSPRGHKFLCKIQKSHPWTNQNAERSKNHEQKTATMTNQSTEKIPAMAHLPVMCQKPSRAPQKITPCIWSFVSVVEFTPIRTLTELAGLTGALDLMHCIGFALPHMHSIQCSCHQTLKPSHRPDTHCTSSSGTKVTGHLVSAAQFFLVPPVTDDDVTKPCASLWNTDKF